MSVVFTRKPATPPKPKKPGHSRPLPVLLDLNQPGWLRVGHLLTLFSISHATLYNRIKQGILPQPDGYDGSKPYWKTETIKKLLEK